MAGIDMNDILGAIAIEVGGNGRKGRKQMNADFECGILPEAQVANLNDILERIEDGNPYEVGDYVTPMEGFATRGCGNPHVVIAVRNPNAVWLSAESSDSAGQGRMADIRVMTYVDDEIVATFWVESWQYERWAMPD